MATPLKMIIMDVQQPRDFIEVLSWSPPRMRRQVVYDDVDVRGRSEPHSFYSHTGQQIWDFEVFFYASIDSGDNGSLDGVQEKATFVESLIMPDYGDLPGQSAVIKPPHLSRITLLQLVDVIGTIRDASWEYPGPYDVSTGQSQIIQCKFALYSQQQFGQSPLGYADIRKLTSRGQNRFTLG